MSEEFESSLRRNKKMAGVEDPIVVVQRLLNIFRQLHILNDQQKADFNQQILQQPPEIRHMCNVLPGGSLLQDYIDELEEKNGITPNQNLDFAAMPSTENNILASALAADSQKQEKASAETTTSTENSNLQSLELQKQMLLMMQNLQNQSARQNFQQQSSSATIHADASFAKDIASAIASAMSASDEKRRKEIYALAQALAKTQKEMTSSIIKEIAKKEPVSQVVATESGGNVKIIDNTQEITKAITESQLEMAKMFLQHNAINANNNNASNANNIQINNIPAANNQDLIADIIKAQSHLFREMAKEQTKEISTIISGALKESNKLSNQHLIKALGEFQKENLNFLKQHSQQQAVYYQPLPNVVGTDAQSPAVYENNEDVSDNYQNESFSGLKQVFNNMLNLGQKRTSFDVKDEDLSENDNQNNFTDFENIPLSQENESSDFVENTTSDIISADPSREATSSSKKKKKKDKKKKKGENKTETTPLNSADQELIDLLGFNDTQNLEQENTLFDNNINDEDAQKFFEDLSLPESSESSDDTTSEPSQEAASTDADGWEWEYEDESSDDTNSEPSQEATSTDADDWEWEYEDESSDDTNSEPSQEATSTDADDWEWEYEDEPSDDTTSDPSQEAASTDADDWEWEYEDEPSDDTTSEPSQEAASTDADDWEWEYEDEPSDDTTSEPSQEAASTDADGWEWEYEDEPSDDTTSEPSQEAASTDADDWEWEYEDEPSDDTTSDPSQEATSTDADDWEWEYEDEASDESEPSSQTDTFEQTKENIDADKEILSESVLPETISQSTNTSTVDPYSADENVSDDLSFSDLQSGEISAQEEFHNTQSNTSSEKKNIPAEINDFFVPDFSSENDENEPYHANSDLKP